MGWMFKGLVVIVGLITLGAGLWPISLLCFAYIGYAVWASTRRRRIYVRDERGQAQIPQVKKSHFKKRYVLAGFSFLLALVALGDRGTYSPVAFGSIGALIVASGMSARGPSFSEVRPVPGSVVLKNRWLPFSWVSLVEVKFGTLQLSRALALAGREFIVAVESQKASVYLPIYVTALSVPQAEAKVADALAPVAKMMSSRGAYLLPLDSREASGRLDWTLKRVDLPLEYGRDGVASLDSAPFDVLVLAPANHLLESAAAYVSQPNKKPGGARMPRKGKKLESQPLMWEALEKLGEKYLPQSPDGMTNFLSSVCATRGESLGDRLVNGGETDSGTILVGSLGATKIELTRPQLRAIVSAYD
jgi:hypothetical protein